MSQPDAFDLDGASREALELDSVLAYAASFAAMAPGRARILGLQPSTAREALEAEHAAVHEARVHREEIGALIPARLPDPEPALIGLRVTDLVVDPVPLRDLGSALLAAGDLRRQLSALDPAAFPSLRELGRSISDASPIAARVVASIAPDGTLEDAASAELRRIRLAIAKTGERLRRQLESFVNDPSAGSVIRDEFVTQRNGRFVIPVRADAPRPVEGIVHAASSSGQTLFVEPIESVALNNELVRLADQEAAERERVIRGFCDRFREELPAIEVAIERLARADTLQARASFAAAIEGCRPEFPAEGALRLIDARHPLLDRRLKEQRRRCVPVSIEIDEAAVLVISGPNTGGKTVALKTAGLACLMAQCGLPVASRRAMLPVFRQLRADIGDHQSIDADLSTFSAHVRAIAEDIDDAHPPALFLFDEIGTGTEPGEGAALGQAVLERLLDLGVTAIATTHHAALKSWAFDDPRVASAAMEFDEATLQPTYRVISGVAGASAGIEIAARLGLDAAVIARARDLAGRHGIDWERTMARLRDATADAEARVSALTADKAALDDERKRLAFRAEEQRTRHREEAGEALTTALREFRETSKKELQKIRDDRERAKVERSHVQAESRLRALAAEKRERLAPTPKRIAAPFTIAPGARVRIVSLDREGEIVSVRGERVEVRMGAATFTVARGDLTAPDTLDAPKPATPSKASRLAALAAASRSRGPDAEVDSVPVELHLLGMTVDEALPAVDRFLDASTRMARTEVRIVHGHGTGRLRQAVRAHLKSHPQAASFRAGAQNEGGDGATIVTLA